MQFAGGDDVKENKSNILADDVKELQIETED